MRASGESDVDERQLQIAVRVDDRGQGCALRAEPSGRKPAPAREEAEERVGAERGEPRHSGHHRFSRPPRRAALLRVDQVIRHTGSFKAGRARLSFLLPKAAKGKLLKVKIRITIPSSDQTVAHTYDYGVR